MSYRFQRIFWRTTLSLALKPFVRVRVSGLEHLEQSGPLIIVCNHFSYWDPIILMSSLPLRVRFMAAIEMTRIPFFSHLLKVFEGIPVWRGQVDREALKVAENHLAAGGNIGVFPEGGIIPELQARVARGEKIVDVPNTKSRIPAVLAEARPGTAYVAVNSDARILPIALVGTEKLEGDLRRFSLLRAQWRRTQVEIRIGAPFGPFTVEEGLRGRAKRRELDRMGRQMMQHIADLLPEDQRGVYHRTADSAETTSPPQTTPTKAH